MKILKFLLEFLLISTSIEGRDDIKIQGGYDADIRRFPFLGSLRFRKNPDGIGCSSNLIDPITALTAGHCIAQVDKTPPVLKDLVKYGPYVIMGVTNWKDKENPLYQQRDVIKVFLHSKAKYASMFRASMIPTEHDIGAVKLSKAMVFTHTVQLTPFPPETITRSDLYEEIMGRNGRCEIAGWGYTRVNNDDRTDTGEPPLTLNCAKFDVLSKDDCCNRYARRSFTQCSLRLGTKVSGYLCHERHKINTSINTGDSGSPLICPYKGKCYVVGLHVGSERDYDPPGARLVHVKNPGYFVTLDVIYPYSLLVKRAQPVFVSSEGEKTNGFNFLAVITSLILIF